jgi:hypothetical protein
VSGTVLAQSWGLEKQREPSAWDLLAQLKSGGERMSLKRVFCLLGCIAGLSACETFQESNVYQVDTYVWDIPNISKNQRYFPEKDNPTLMRAALGTDVPDFRSDAFKKGVAPEEIFGLAFAGGGTRAATMALGQLRAFHELGWINKVHYISAVSGGAWAVTPYSFLPGNGTDTGPDSHAWKIHGNPSFGDRTFLGPYIPPEDIRWSEIKEEQPDGSLAKAISESWLGARTIWHLVSTFNDEAYATSVGDVFLKPFGLSKRVGFFGYQRETFALRPSSVEHSGLPLKNFHFLRCGRPYPIINATVITKGFRHTQDHLHRLEITPDYAGVPVRFNVPGTPVDNPPRFGGQYIQSFAYDLHKRLGAVDVKPFRRWRVETGGFTGSFSLADVVGVSGAAPQATLARVGIGNLGFPEYHLWPHETGADLQVPKRDFYHGDGGHLENAGLMPLLARQVQNIIVFVNTHAPIKCRKEGCEPVTRGYDIKDEVIAPYLVSFFKKLSKKGKYFHNQVIDEPDKKLSELVTSFETKKREGAPLIHCDEYDIMENKRFGVPRIEGYKPNICWIYLDRSDRWLNAIPDKKIREEYAVRKWRNLPHFKTFLPSLFKPAVVDLSDAEVNLGSNLAAWSVCEGADALRKGLSPGLKLELERGAASKCYPAYK